MTWHLSKAIILAHNQLLSSALQAVFAHVQTHIVFIVLMQVHAALLGLPPSLRYIFVDIGLVDDLGYELRAVVDSWRIRGRDVRTMNGVGGAVFDKKCQESKDGADEEDDY